jgi:hypothetical protein
MAEVKAKAAKAVAAAKIEQGELYENAVDRFIKYYAKPAQRTWYQTEQVLKGSCAKLFGRPLTLITRPEVLALLRGFVDAGHPY